MIPFLPGPAPLPPPADKPTLSPRQTTQNEPADFKHHLRPQERDQKAADTAAEPQPDRADPDTGEDSIPSADQETSEKASMPPVVEDDVKRDPTVMMEGDLAPLAKPAKEVVAKKADAALPQPVLTAKQPTQTTVPIEADNGKMTPPNNGEVRQRQSPTETTKVTGQPTPPAGADDDLLVPETRSMKEAAGLQDNRQTQQTAHLAKLNLVEQTPDGKSTASQIALSASAGQAPPQSQLAAKQATPKGAPIDDQADIEMAATDKPHSDGDKPPRQTTPPPPIAALQSAEATRATTTAAQADTGANVVIEKGDPIARFDPPSAVQDRINAPMQQAQPTATADQARQIAQQLANAAPTTLPGTTEITLQPEELGRVRMTLTVQDGTMTMVIQADRLETSDLMRRHIDQLAQSYRQMGFDTLNFSFAGSAGQESGSDSNPSLDTPGWQGGAVDDSDETTRAALQSPTDGRLDLRM